MIFSFGLPAAACRWHEPAFSTRRAVEARKL
jgi:hypothetical protein